MTSLKISNLAHKLGSNKVSYTKLSRKYPSWNINEVKLKTGIDCIYQSKTNEDVLSLSLQSSKKTLKNFDKKKINAVLVVTQTAKNKLPSISCILQDQLGLKKNIIAYDINLGCSGFVYALSNIYSLFEANLASNVLLVCSDTYTKYLDKNNRTCRTIFSDSASSCIIQKKKSNKIMSFVFHTDGSGYKSLIENDNLITMNGSEVFYFTTQTVPKLFKKALRKINLKKEDIDHFIFHQASKLVLDKLSNDIDLPIKQFHTNYKKIGNTTSASIPIILENLAKKKIIKNKQRVMMIGFGVGLSAAVTIVEW
jgi:3-oxoacyl-[acyl-carrier-protein] synthase-3